MVPFFSNFRLCSVTFLKRSLNHDGLKHPEAQRQWTSLNGNIGVLAGKAT